MNRDSLIRAAVFCALVAVAVAVRLASDLPNFNAVIAAALFAGFYFRHRLTAVCVPLVAMSISDLFLGGYSRPMMAAVYLSLLVPIAWSGLLRRHLSPLVVGSGAVCSSLSHFALSNLAVWYLWYPRSWQGLVECYAVALPFLRNSISSDLLFSAGFFGLYVLAIRWGTQRSADVAVASEAA